MSLSGRHDCNDNNESKVSNVERINFYMFVLRNKIITDSSFHTLVCARPIAVAQHSIG